MKWRVRKCGAVWGVFPPGLGAPTHTYWDHSDAIRRAQELARSDGNGRFSRRG
jgi:hypothetical protein